MKLPWAITLILILNVLSLVILTALLIEDSQQKNIIVRETIVGTQGPIGPSAYTPVKGVDYFDGRDGKPGPIGPTGLPGYTPIKGIDYVDGKDGEPGSKGEPGEQGKAGKEVEFRCRDFPVKPSRVEWRYVGDDSWTILHELKDKCKVG